MGLGMRRSVLIAFVTFAVCPFNALGQESGRELPPAEAERVLEQIAQAQAKVRTIRATVVQKRSSTLLKNNSVTEGRLEAKRPGLIRWEVGKPSRSITWIGPGGVTIYYPDQKMAKTPPRWAVARAGGGLDKLFAFSDRPLAEIRQEHDVRVWSESGAVRVKLVPRNEGAAEMAFVFSPGDYTLREVAVLPPGGRTVTLTFRDMRVNAEIPDARFLPDLPPGTAAGEM